MQILAENTLSSKRPRPRNAAWLAFRGLRGTHRRDPFDDAIEALDDAAITELLADVDDSTDDPIVTAMEGILARRAQARLARADQHWAGALRRPALRARGRAPRRRRARLRRIRRTGSSRGSPSSDGAAAPPPSSLSSSTRSSPRSARPPRGAA
jgi:hypothetical protein